MSNENQAARQWHSICLNIVTLSTASIGAAIVLAGLPYLGQKTTTAYITTTILLILAINAHIYLAGATALVIFRETGPRPEHTQRRLTIIVYSLFTFILLILAAIVISNTILDYASTIPSVNANRQVSAS